MITWEQIEASKELQGSIFIMFGLMPEDIKLAYDSLRERTERQDAEIALEELGASDK